MKDIDQVHEEGKFWDREFVEHPGEGFKCFLHHSPWLKKRLTKRFLDRIHESLGPGVAVLDLGCGQGWLSLMMAGTGADVTGMDVAERCLEHARAEAGRLGYGQCRFEYFDANRQSLPPERFDMIISWGTLHHIQRLDHALGQIERALKPGGRFFLIECEDQPGLRGKLARGLADLFHLLLPTDRSYLEKLRQGWRKLRRGEQELEWSPAEMAGQGWLAQVKDRFEVDHEERFMGFLAPFVARIQLPAPLREPIVAALFVLDSALLKFGILTPEYYFMVLRPRGGRKERTD